MQRNYPLHFQLFSMRLYTLLPAAIASVVAGLLPGQYERPAVVMPTAALGAPASVEAMQMVRDEHELIVSYLQAYTEARQQTDLAAEEEMLSSRALEKAAMLAASEAKAAETRALTIAANVAPKPEKKVAAIRPTQELNLAVIGKPLQLVQLASATTQIQPVVQPATPPARHVSSASRSEENLVKAKFHEVTAMVEKIPLWVHSVTTWFSGDAPPHRVLQLQAGLS
jgi:hypothetical protein